MIVLRDYQDFAYPAWLKWIRAGKGDPLLLYPTGVGKSVILADIQMQALREWPQLRTMTMTHSKQLVRQDHMKLKEFWPMAPVGIYCDGLNKKEHWLPITIGSIQSCHNLASLFGHIDLFFIDEAHLISLKEASMYRKFIKELRVINPNMVVTGLTATGWRGGQGWLWEGEGALFSGAAVDACSMNAFNWFLDQGYIIPPHSAKNAFKYNMDGVSVQGGEYNQKEAEEAVNKPKLNERVVIAALEEFQNYHVGMTFGQGINHVVELSKLYNHYGCKACFVHSKMGGKEVDATVAAFLGGEYEMIVNNGILTTGFDDPRVDFMSIDRAMKSSQLWIQILGRGTRPLYAPGFDLRTREGRLAAIGASTKHHFRVMDFAANIESLGPINDPVIPKPKGARRTPGDAPIRICPNCGTYNHASVPACSHCGLEFPRREKLTDEASTATILKVTKVPPLPPAAEYTSFDVDHITYANHHKRGSLNPCLKMTYQCGLRSFVAWSFPQGNPGQRAAFAKLWLERANCDIEDIPQTVSDALRDSDTLRVPRSITVVINRPNPEVVGYEY